MQMLKRYWWPGNIRELENLIERLVAVSDKDYITEEDLPLEFHFAQLEPQGARTDSLFEDATNTFERNFILRALEKCGWNVTGDRRIPRRAAEHAEIQDGQARCPAAGPADPGALTRAGEGAQRPERPPRCSPPWCFRRRPMRGSASRERAARAAYLRGRTASFSCLAMRALTTVLAGILIASPVAGLRPMRALRF